MRRAFLVALAFAALGGAARAADRDARHALLTGVTSYPHLRADLALEGGANDVLMLRRLLVEKFGFPEANITVLSEAEGAKDAKRLPSRENVQRAMKEFAARVPAGGQALVLLSGHGSRQPEKPGLKNPQPDGFDKIFLPRDVKGFDLGEGAVTNAISGREIGDWLRPIPKKKAGLWVIVDACHSGEMVRGRREKARQLDMTRDLKIPEKLIQAAEKRATKTRGPVAGVPYHGPLGHEAGVVLTYACLSSQTTLEGGYADPYGKGERKKFGLFTHTMVEVLLAADDVLSYRELITRVINSYTAKGREGLTPVIDGAAQSLAVLGKSSVSRPAFLISRPDDKLTVNAGQLHGLTLGTVLAAYPPPGKKGGLIGHVRVSELAPTRSTVVPTAHGKSAAPAADKLLGCRCEVAELVYDDLRLKLAVDQAGSKAPKEKLAALDKVLASMGKEENSPVRHVADAARADWLARLDGDKLYLVPASDAVDERKAAPRRALGPAPPGVKHADWLEASCARVVRAENLKRLAASARAEKARGAETSRPRVSVQVTRENATPEEKAAALPAFYAGDRLQIRLENKGKVPIDVTVLYVDSQFGITALFPSLKRGQVNRIQPGRHAEVSGVTINGSTLGREHIVVIAVASRGDELADFVALSQKAVEAVRRDVKTRSAAKRGAGSPMGLLLQKAMFGEGGKRGVTVEAIDEFQSDLVPIQVAPGKRP